MPSKKNEQAVAQIKDQLGKAKSILFADYSGLDVAAQTDLRAEVAKVGGEFTVQKNTLLKIALKEEAELTSELEEALNGPTAVLYGYEDAVSAVKALVDFAKDHKALEIKIGLLGTDKVLTLEQIKNLAELPTKEELYAQLLARLNAPRAGMVNVLAGNLRGLVQVLKAIQEDKQE